MDNSLSGGYYQKNKEKLQKKLLERYHNLFEEEKEKMRQYGRERYKILPGHKK